MRMAMLIVCAGASVSSAAHAGVLKYDDFSDTTGLVINSSAAVVGDNGFDSAPVLRLADTDNFTAGSVFTNQRMDISRFSTEFSFRIQPGFVNGSGTDGFVFAMQPTSPFTKGGTGGNLGYQGLGTPVKVGVEFDLFNNFQDPSSNHIGINTDTTSSLVTANISPDFDNRNLWHAWIDYDGTTLEVRVTESDTRPDQPQLALAIDLVDQLLTTDVYVGFTASTGGDASAHDIVSWRFVPEPASAALLAAGLIVTIGLGRRPS